ncbi:Dop1p [Sugiyamaella lignohabitans]|uniref:Dop1p n=1 Tax=Sugiyamaella lignohabitans TaxID=796027 RepID=A0A167C7I3_9ASCO|nr:Dop1p [Sugiyamaella lignohabitans]ANB11316.1 Dop1p [Sugiyamaella lignohabitans]
MPHSPTNKPDPKWKQFVSAVDRALATWESVQEWADYISFLGKLHRALKGGQGQAFVQIPSARIVAFRLATCLDPGLPSGVHQKTLEVYNSVFDILNGQELHFQIHLWLPGLLPLMSYGSINVKPLLIELFERHILPLPSLRSILKPLLLSFLPGIDDETSESFDEVLKLIEDIKLKVNDDSHFWQCLFLVIISSKDRRPGALIWANRKFPSFAAISQSIDVDSLVGNIPAAYQALSYDAQMAVSPETGLLMRAFSRGLQDEHLLVQRGFLELLVKNLELQSPVLQAIASKDDLKLLVISACSTVLRRDMSLNRRLWIWLLGPEPITTDSPSSGPHYSRAEYFAKFALEPLTTGLLEMIESDPEVPAERTRPYKICLSILDRWEIGTSVVPKILLPVIKSVQRYSNANRSDAEYEEVLRSAGALFDGVEAINIWSDVLNLILSGGDENMQLVLFILQVFNIRDEEMIVNHLPMILLALLYKEDRSDVWFKITSLILDAIPDRAFLPIHHADQTVNDESNASPLERIQEYYKLTSDEAVLPFSPGTLSLLLLNRLAELTQSELEKLHQSHSNQIDSAVDVYITANGPSETGSNTVDSAETAATSNNEDDASASAGAGELAALLSSLLEKIPEQQSWRNHGLVNALINLGQPISYTTLSGVITLFITIYDSFNEEEVDEFLFSIAKVLFAQLSTSSNKHQVEIVQAIWAIQEKLDDQRVESALVTVVSEPGHDPLIKVRVFSILWQHSINRVNAKVILERYLFFVLDLLSEEDDGGDIATLVHHWLKCVVTSGTAKQLLDFIIIHLLETNESGDIRSVIYYLDTLIRVLSSNAALRSTYANEELTGKKYPLVIFHEIERIMYRSADSNDRDSQHALNSCLELLDITEVKQESRLLDHSMLLLSVLGYFYGSRDIESLPQVSILRLLSKFLLQLNNVSPIWKQIYSSDLFAAENTDSGRDEVAKKSLPKTLFQCLVNGLSSSKNEYVVRAWADFLKDILPLFGQGVIQVIIPLVECLCKAISQSFDETRSSLFENKSDKNKSIETAVFYPYMDALEHLLVTAHEKVDSQDWRGVSAKNNNDPSFFGNVISGVFAVESPISRPAAANDRLTVLLCFQDAVRTSYNVWKCAEQSCKPSHDPTDSVVFVLSPLKSRSRKLLAKLYSLETLEMLECFIELSRSSGGDVFKVLHVLDGSRPKLTIPYLFNALISRMNSSSLEPADKSTLTTDLTDTEIMEFLINYLKSLENDTIEEVWYECMGFVREVYNNQSLYRMVIPSVLRFTAKMAEKVDAVKFGSQRKVRKDLSDLFLKLLHFALNTRSAVTVEANITNGETVSTGATGASAPALSEKDIDDGSVDTSVPSTPHMSSSTTSLALQYNQGTSGSSSLKQEDLIKALEQIVPSLRLIINDQDKTLTAITSITTNLVTPALRQKNYSNVSPSLMSLLKTITHLPSTLKAWKGIVGDAFLDPRFLGISMSQASELWQPVISKWSQFDKERIKDYVSRISSYGTNSNVLFNWSDQESSIQSQNLDRLAYLFICGTGDGFAFSFKDLMTKFELLSVGRNTQHVYLCLRAIILSVDPSHLAPVWTFLYSHLSSTFLDFLDQDKNVDLETLVAACRLLDTTLVLNPEEFQSYEWLFISDSMDAIFRNEDRDPSGIVDRISASKLLPPAQTVSGWRAYLPPAAGAPPQTPWLLSLRSSRC